MPASPLVRLEARIAASGAPLCVGIDPVPERLPAGLPRTADGVAEWGIGIVRAVAPHAAAIKLNLAFFEALGADGWRALQRIRDAVPSELIVIADAKRGDIGTTAERYAVALLDRLGVDAVTLSPFLGEDAIEPFLSRGEQLVYVLARTSNPSAGRLQSLRLADGGTLSEAVAAWAAERWPDGRVGLVVGATEPAELGSLRALVPGPGFLVPGIGAQGGDLDAALASVHGARAPGLIAASRSIAEASVADDWAEAAEAAARALVDRMRGAGATLGHLPRST
ncbi:MAG: orotidine-5'-phosphate decarboxylase [Chloroflexota bacterium]